jgi:hypothetical protein
MIDSLDERLVGFGSAHHRGRFVRRFLRRHAEHVVEAAMGRGCFEQRRKAVEQGPHFVFLEHRRCDEQRRWRRRHE